MRLLLDVRLCRDVAFSLSITRRYVDALIPRISALRCLTKMRVLAKFGAPGGGGRSRLGANDCAKPNAIRRSSLVSKRERPWAVLAQLLSTPAALCGPKLHRRRGFRSQLANFFLRTRTHPTRSSCVDSGYILRDLPRLRPQGLPGGLYFWVSSILRGRVKK